MDPPWASGDRWQSYGLVRHGGAGDDNYCDFARVSTLAATAQRQDYLLSSGSKVRILPGTPCASAASNDRPPRSSDLASLPDLFGGPPPSPLSSRELVTSLRPPRGLDLDQVDDFEAAPTEQADPVSMRDMELDAVVVGPLKTVHAELVP